MAVPDAAIRLSCFRPRLRIGLCAVSRHTEWTALAFPPEWPGVSDFVGGWVSLDNPIRSVQ